MPCRDGGPSCDDYTLLRNKIDELTDLLCSQLNYLEEIDYASVIQKGPVLAWWKAHKKADAERLKKEKAEQVRERAKEVAYNKLTHAERKLLGL